MSWQARLQQTLERTWYGGAPVAAWLAVLELVYGGMLNLRRALYRARILRPVRAGVPVVVVGNVTVGGTGKTPLVVALASELRQRGWSPGIVLRGYGGHVHGPEIVPHDADPARYGDEAVLLARSGETPVAVARRRVEGAVLLVAQAGCDVVISDDGLQHWALSRDIEIVVIDGQPVNDEALKAMSDALKARLDKESTALFGTARLWDDGIIDPRDTRTVLAISLSAAYCAPVAGTMEFGIFRH